MSMEFERIADKKRTEFIVQAVTSSTPCGQNILDVGCGNGIISRALGQEQYQVTGIDVSETTIAMAQSLNSLDNVRFKVVPAHQLQPEPEKYAAIICSEVLEHLEAPENLLKILRLSLKKDGLLIVTVPNGLGPRELLVTRPVQYLQQKNVPAWKVISSIKKRMGYSGITIQSSAEDLRHIQFFTVRSLRKLAFRSQFRIEKIKSTNFLEQVFPFSLLAKRSSVIQQADCRIADWLPLVFTSGFMSVWRKVPE